MRRSSEQRNFNRFALTLRESSKLKVESLKRIVMERRHPCLQKRKERFESWRVGELERNGVNVLTWRAMSPDVKIPFFCQTSHAMSLQKRNFVMERRLPASKSVREGWKVGRLES